MKKILLCLCLLISFSPLFGIATVKDFFGKVKVKYAGDSTWSRLTIGQEIPANATVSTGFNSQIVLDLGNATLDVLPLTRMTVSEITETQDTISTSLFLQGGKITADVGKIDGKVNDFKIKSPVATASVRGTAFGFSGNTLTVIRGEVAFSPTKKKDKPSGTSGSAEEEEEEDAEDEGDVVAVKAGGQTEMVSPTSKPVDPGVIAKNNSSISPSTKPAIIRNVIVDNLSGDGSKPEVPTPSDIQNIIDTIARVTITISFEEE
ncbi:MAG: FecR family protein [Spirochaetaceae bacterium]